MPQQPIDYTMRYQTRAGRVNFANYVQRRQLVQDGRLLGLNTCPPDNDASIVSNIENGATNTTPAEYAEYLAQVTLPPVPTPPTPNPSSLCSEGSLNTIATYLRNYMTEFRNSNFWAYTCDGDEEGNYINDGGEDMFDTGNFVTPWLLSGDLYNLTSTSLNNYPYHISYSTETQTVIDTDFNYVSLGWIYEEDTDEPQINQSRHPITVMGYRCAGPVGWQVGGNIGADGSGDATSGYVYTNSTVNGFTVYAGYRQVYNAGDPTICHLVILLGHPSWNSVFGAVSLTADDDDTNSCQFIMYSGTGSENILGLYTLLSKPPNDDSEPISNTELETIIGNFTLRIKESMNL